MNIKQLSLLGLMSACIISQTQASAFRKVMPTVIGAGALLTGLKKGFEFLNNSEEFYIESTLPEETKGRIREIYQQQGKGNIRILEQKLDSPLITEKTNTIPFRLQDNVVVLPEPACIALKKGHVNRTYLTPQEVEASLHVTAALSSSFQDWAMFSPVPAALVARKLGQLKSKTGGRVGLVAGYLGAQLIANLIPLYPWTNNFNLQDSKTASAAASCYRKAGNHGFADSLEKIAEALRAQGK